MRPRKLLTLLLSLPRLQICGHCLEKVPKTNGKMRKQKELLTAPPRHFGCLDSACLQEPPDLGDTWRYGYPKSLDWNGNVESWTECEGTSSSVQCEHHLESLALNVMAKVQSGEKITLFLGRLGICEGGFELPHRPGHVVPKKCMRPGSRTASAKRPFVTAREAFLSPWTGCDKTERDVRGNEGRRNVSDEPF